MGSGIIINPAAFTFTSIAILDALKMFDGPIIELHISNIHKREAYYHHSYVSKVATAIIAGFGPEGYRVATSSIKKAPETTDKSMKAAQAESRHGVVIDGTGIRFVAFVLLNRNARYKKMPLLFYFPLIVWMGMLEAIQDEMRVPAKAKARR